MSPNASKAFAPTSLIGLVTASPALKAPLPAIVAPLPTKRPMGLPMAFAPALVPA